MIETAARRLMAYGFLPFLPRVFVSVHVRFFRHPSSNCLPLHALMGFSLQVRAVAKREPDRMEPM